MQNPELVARQTPHRFRPKTPESFDKLRTGSASPLGEGEEPPLLRGRGAFCKGLPPE